MAFADTAQLTVQLDLKGNLKAGLRDASRAISGFDKATSNTQRSLSKFGSNIQRGVAVGLAATTAGFVGVVKAAADYESAFAGVRKTVEATEPQLQKLSDSFRRMSKEIPISAAELARLGEAGGALGISTANLEEFVRVTALLGETTDLTADQAATSLGTLSNVLKLTSADYSKFASALVALGNAGASTESQIIGITERSGAAAELVGFATEQTLAWGSAVASLGIEVEAGGSSLQTFYLGALRTVSSGDALSAAAKAGGVSVKELTAAIDKGGAALDRIAKKTGFDPKELKKFATTTEGLALMAEVAGTTGEAFKQAFEKDASGALTTFLQGLSKLKQGDQLSVLKELGFNDIRITRTLLGLAGNTKLLTDATALSNEEFRKNTALTKEAEERFNTFDSQLQKTKNHLTDIGITIGSKLLPKITPLLKRLNDFVGANQDKIAEFGDKLASGFETFADALGKVNWQPFIDGLKLTSQIAKTAIDLFMALPAEVKAVAIGAFAVNKVTGGLPTAIAKDAGSLLLQRFAERGSSPANPMWVATAGGLPGAPGAAGGKGGGIGGALKTGAKLAGGIGVAIIGIELLGELIKATSTPEQRAAAEANALDQNQRKRNPNFGKPTPVVITNRGFAAQQTAHFAQVTGQFSSQQAAHSAEINRADPAALVKLASTLGSRAVTTAFAAGFRQMVAALKSARKPADIAAAVKQAVAVTVKQGRGSAEGTKNVLAALKAQLKTTHDPATARILRAAIAQVERKIPGREFAQKQIQKADAILKSNQTGTRKIEELKGIEKSLRDRGLPKAAAQINAKIDQAKRAQVIASIAAGVKAATAINNKDLSVSVSVPVTNNVSIRSIINGYQVVSSYGHTAVARGAVRVIS